jgi:hypothetical protein
MADDMARLEVRIERLEAIVVLLCEEAAHGQGSMGKPFWAFVDDWRREHAALDNDKST